MSNDIYFKPSYGDIKEIFNALDNSGSGGGGYIGNIQKSGKGGSGIVIIRFKNKDEIIKDDYISKYN